MAHAAKYKRADLSGLVAHYERKKDKDGNYIKLQNQDIDQSRTHLNYNLCDEHNLTPYQFVKKRMGEVKHNHRRTQNVFCDWIITLPDQIKQEDQEKFFRATYEFLKRKYGAKNIICAWVHLDETTPHMHFAFMPVEQTPEGEKLNAKAIINRTTLRKFHNELKDELDRVLGYDSGVLNGITEQKKGNRTIEELKQDNTYLARKNNVLKQKNEELEKDNKTLSDINSDLKNKNQLLQQQIEHQQKEIIKLKLEKKSLIERIKELIDMIRPIERLKNLIWTIKTFADDFIEFEENLCQKYDITEQEFQILQENAEIIVAEDNLDDLIDKINDVQKDLDQDENKHDFEMTL